MPVSKGFTNFTWASGGPTSSGTTNPIALTSNNGAVVQGSWTQAGTRPSGGTASNQRVHGWYELCPEPVEADRAPAGGRYLCDPGPARARDDLGVLHLYHPDGRDRDDGQLPAGRHRERVIFA